MSTSHPHDQTDATSAFDFEDVTFVMGTYNEAEAIGTVLADIDRVSEGQAAVICVDSSDDETADIARDHGATVIEQAPQGYGVALERGLRAADRPVIVTTDCDDTYPMEAVPRFLSAINAGADVVSGDRLTPGAQTMPALNRVGNRLFASLASLFMLRRVHDVTTGMRAFRHDVIDAIDWTENTGLSAELLMRPIMRGYAVQEEPIEYRERVGDTTLDPIRGGGAILASIVRVGLEERIGR